MSQTGHQTPLDVYKRQVEDPVKDGSYQQAQFGAYLGGSDKPRTKALDGCFAPSLRLQQMYSRGDARLEQPFMLEFHTCLLYTSKVSAYYPEK